MNYPKISIVTPSFNSAKFIEDCIQSGLAQNYDNFEHIIIDGGSTDGTIEILKKYSHLKWISEPDEGQSDALNKGFEIANGEIICWLNSDDLLLRDVFQNVAVFNNDSWDVLYGDFYLVDENLNKLRRVRPIEFDEKIFIYYGPYLPSSGSFFRKRIFIKGNYLNINHHFNMDRLFFLQLNRKGYKFKYSGIPYSYFRVHHDNKSIEINESKTKQKISDRQLLETKAILSEFGFNSSSEKLNQIAWFVLRYIYRVKLLLIRLIKGRFSKQLN